MLAQGVKNLLLPSFNRRYLHRTARNLAAALRALHESDYVIGDLNESNVMVTPSALVTVIDADSFQVLRRVGNFGLALKWIDGSDLKSADGTPGDVFSSESRVVFSVATTLPFTLALMVWLGLLAGTAVRHSLAWQR